LSGPAIESIQKDAVPIKAEIEARLPPWLRSSFQKEFHIEGGLKESFSVQCNLLVVAPHGFPGDDDNTDYLAYLLGRLLGCGYLINNKLYRKPSNKRPYGIAADLNMPWSGNPHADYFIGRIITHIGFMRRMKTGPPLVLILHGMADKNADRIGVDFCLGAGYEWSERPRAFEKNGKATASPVVVDGMIKGLESLGHRVKEGVKGYTGSKSLPGFLREKRSEIGHVDAVQLEVRYSGYRDPKNIFDTALLLSKAMKSVKDLNLQE
jgi:hypothetical protein